MKQKFNVGGMSCSACSSAIEKAVKKLDGVNTAEVSLIEKTMSVEYDEKVTDNEKIIRAVVSAGYTAKPYQKSQKKDNYAKQLLLRFLISAVFMLAILYLSMGSMVGLWVPADKIGLPIQFALCTIVMLVNIRFYINGIKAVIHLSPNMDTLVTLGTFTAYIYSVVISVIFLLGGHVGHSESMHGMGSVKVFYMSAAMILTFVTAGKFLEEISKKRTGDAIDRLEKFVPDTVTVKRGEGTVKIPLGELKEGDTVVVMSGDYVPCDGVITKGFCSVDKSAITGESLPEELSENGRIVSGSIVKSGYAEFIADKVGEDALFSKIINCVKEASAKKAPIQKFADKVAGIFVPIVTLIALITFTVWISVTGDLYKSLTYTIDVFVISCPCALGLATPVAVVVATGTAATHGILFKNAETIQKAAGITAMLLDKTATITQGKVTVTEAGFYGDEDYLKKVCYSLEERSNHPLAESIKDYCVSGGLDVENFEYIVGKGMKGEIDGKTYRLGNALLTGGDKKEKDAQVYLSCDKEVLAYFKCEDVLKDGAKGVAKDLAELNVKTVMITGDSEAVAQKIARETGITEYYAGVLPEDKFAKVEEYKGKGYVVGMCGDGINDSPALSSADVGIAMGTGTDVAIDSADVVLVSGNVAELNDLIKIAKKTVNIIKGNLFWALVYNVIAIPVAAGVLSPVGISLSPAISAACMSLSSVFVVLNALRINRLKKKNNIIEKENNQEGDYDMKVFIEGMMCAHCEGRVNEAISGIEGVKSVKANHKKGYAKVKGENLSEADIKAAVENAGYTFKGIEK